ncbi:hypothetical protein V2J09_012204 [Rumex salicifolius]
MLKQGFNGFRFRSTLTYLQSLESFIFYSTSVASNDDGVTTPPMVEYLVNSIGFSEREAVAISTKVRHPLKCIKKSLLVVDFLREMYPECSDVTSIKPKIRAFQDVGFLGSDFYGVCLLTKTSEEKVDSNLEVFRTYGWNETEISELLKKYPLCLAMSEKSMELKLKFSWILVMDLITWLLILLFYHVAWRRGLSPE